MRTRSNAGGVFIFGAKPDPTADEIAAGAARIQASWSDPELRARLGLPRHRNVSRDDAYVVPWSIPVSEEPHNVA